MRPAGALVVVLDTAKGSGGTLAGQDLALAPAQDLVAANGPTIAKIVGDDTTRIEALFLWRTAPKGCVLRFQSRAPAVTTTVP